MLWGTLGSLLRLYGITVMAVLLDVPGYIASILEGLAETARTAGLQAVETELSNMMLKMIFLLAAMPLTIVLLVTGIAAWFAGGSLIEKGWKRLTGAWSKRARYALLAFNIMGTLLWVLGVLVIIYPLISVYLGTNSSYITAVIQVARNIKAALLAFILSALTPVAASIIHATQAWGRGGKIASFLLLIGGLIYAANAVIVYMAWREFATRVLHFIPVGTASITPDALAAILDGLAEVAKVFTTYLRIAMVTYAVWVVGFLAAWWDYWRASKGK